MNMKLLSHRGNTLKKFFVWLDWISVAACSIFMSQHLNSWRVGSSSLTRDGTWAPALGEWSLNRWATREVPKVSVLKHTIW